MSFLVSVVVFAAVVVAFIFAERLFRSPSRPRWLDREMVVMLLCVAFTGAFAGSIGALVATALLLPIPLWADAGIVVLAIAVVVGVARRLLRTTAGSGAAAG